MLSDLILEVAIQISMAVGCPLVAHFHLPFMPFFLFSNENWSISAASVLPTSTIRIYTIKTQLSVVTHTVTEQSFRTHLPIDITWTQKPWALVFDSFSAINVKVLVWTKLFFFSLWWKTFISSTKMYFLVFQDKHAAEETNTLVLKNL